MTKLIAKPAPISSTFIIGQRVFWSNTHFDGRSYENYQNYGDVIKINRVNLIVKDNKGYVWEIKKNKISTTCPCCGK